ncbi:RsmB/NOP family class I SAM-dependent RNA methyltransferase [Salipiger mangrovisoli]|uniref:RsmB/NOP family class I SAM-dependent RNA methyltransferase n=1 Tax=Salipiger mangrovisoli TaxID=2865933 RepID=A0ABR9X3U0_9RHOB|nr:RsmB/NOP family class I SAM-dependent RNA methyltransferase [Salipiger mangrovisoli]MBE9638176.1 RsmB/NOP family class I SAM-dependent RNA methyltransferase [Salipiger mangrovisoli]
MTPGARLQAAAEVLDRIAAGAPAEQALLGWARGARYAGSKDRAAVRDHVFDVLRRWRSTAVQGGGESGRARLIGLLRQQGSPVGDVFTGDGHAPAPLTAEEQAAGRAAEGAEARDLPDWIDALLGESLGAGAAAAAEALRGRAAVFLRVNGLRGDLAAAQAALAGEGIETRPHPLASGALEVTAGARRVAQSQAFAEGRVELQDVASQAVVEALPLVPGMRVLDYCAGGGGKALAMAARTQGEVEAHDADPRRMSDLPARAKRAGARIRSVTRPEGAYDLVLCDVPCSGSGAWRRAPEGKWRLTSERLDELQTLQAGILDTAAALVRPGGLLGYATCSMLSAENGAQIRAFLARHEGWTLEHERQYLPGDGGDGFFGAQLRRPA